MALQDVDVVGIEQRVFVGAAQQIGRVAHVVLIERVVEADQHGERGIVAAARAAGLLPQAGDGARDSRPAAPRPARPRRSPAPARWSRSRPAAGRRTAPARCAGDPPAGSRPDTRRCDPPARRSLCRAAACRGITQQQFGDDARPCEGDGAHACADQRREQLAGFMVGAAPGGVAAIQERRIPQCKGAWPVRRAVIGDHDRRQSRQQLEVLGRVGDGGGGGDEDGEGWKLEAGSWNWMLDTFCAPDS